MTLGGYDERQQITWNNLIPAVNKYWTVELTSMSLGERNPISVSVPHAIIDTGTSFITMPSKDLQAIVAYFS